MSKEDLTPFTSENAAIMGARGGHAKKGSKHLSTIIKELADNIDWDKTTLKNKDELKEKYGNNGWKAVVYVAFTKAMTGDTKAMDWLAKNGYGNNIKLEITKDPVDEILRGFGLDVGQTEGDAETTSSDNS